MRAKGLNPVKRTNAQRNMEDMLDAIRVDQGGGVVAAAGGGAGSLAPAPCAAGGGDGGGLTDVVDLAYDSDYSFLFQG